MPNEVTLLGPLARAALCLLALAGLACRHDTSATEACPPCDGAFRTNLALQAQVEAQWRSVSAQLGQPPKLDFRCLCFGAGASTSVEGQNIYLASDWDLREQTARAAHLATHRRQPPWTADSDAPCAARVERALDRETDAHALELETRRALGVVKLRYPFESDYFATPPQQRRQWLRDYFVAHPTGDGVVPGFVASYQARCQ